MSSRSTNASGDGSVSVSPADNTTYTLTVNTPTGSAQSSVTGRHSACIESLTASVPAVVPRDMVTLNWNVRSGANVSLAGIGDVTALTDAQGVGSLAVTHVRNPVTLTATRGAESASSAVAIGFLPPSSLYALLDIGALGGIPEAGAAGGQVIGAGVHDANATNLSPTTLPAGNGGDFTLSIDNLAPDSSAVGGLDWRDLASRRNCRSPTAEELVKNNAGLIHVTLGSLPAGIYDVISYHIDPGLSQSEQIMISVVDADSGGVPRNTGVTASAAFPGHPADTNSPTVPNLTTTVVAQKRFLFSVRSNGTDNVQIYFDPPASRRSTANRSFAGLVIAFRPPTPFDFTAVQFTSGPVTDATLLQFNSTPGETFRILTTTDLQIWNA